MKIALLQTNPQWLAPQANMAQAARLMARVPDAALYVLPEMWATGFHTSPSYDMIDMADEALHWMCQQADRRQAAVAGTLAVREWPAAGTQTGTALWRNRFYFVKPGGEVTFYDKRHLFTYGGEQLTYTPGTERVEVEWQGVRLLLQTCFDLRFPETSRNALPRPYDVVLYAASWPASRRLAWDTLLPARAIENQAYCAGINRTGMDPACRYNGGTAAFDAYGHRLCLLEDKVGVVTFEPDLPALHAFRQKFKVLC